jgi:hypothetical protein
MASYTIGSNAEKVSVSLKRREALHRVGQRLYNLIKSRIKTTSDIHQNIEKHCLTHFAQPLVDITLVINVLAWYTINKTRYYTTS